MKGNVLLFAERQLSPYEFQKLKHRQDLKYQHLTPPEFGFFFIPLWLLISSAVADTGCISKKALNAPAWNLASQTLKP